MTHRMLRIGMINEVIVRTREVITFCDPVVSEDLRIIRFSLVRYRAILQINAYL